MSPSEEMTNQPVTVLACPISLDYAYSAGQSASRFLRAIAEGKLLGQRCPVDGRVYFPSRGACPMHGVTFGDDLVELSDKGTIVTFSIVRVPSQNITLPLPYITVNVLLDGADTILMHVLDAKLEDVHMGMRVQAVWAPPEERTAAAGGRGYGFGNAITGWRPTGEPDAPTAEFAEHVL